MVTVVEQAPQGQQQVSPYQEGDQVLILYGVEAASNGLTGVRTEKNNPHGSITGTEEMFNPDGSKSLVITTKPAT